MALCWGCGKPIRFWQKRVRKFIRPKTNSGIEIIISSSGLLETQYHTNCYIEEQGKGE
ncbi:hypothetical protein KAU43_06310 [candidate division WOR-3 bacterium]|nr:hypothetical protein [candidate division WOR-3 bacterium]